MKKSMLDYSKVILEKVSFDQRLFWKEYQKFCKVLNVRETMELRKWVIQRFSTNLLMKPEILPQEYNNSGY